ncbi:MAG: radical SAM protein [Magnetococcales bacterium]|nr:radical SAM protein [Magnetococcales bacterium]
MTPVRSWHLAQAILRANLNRSPHPYKLTFMVTRRCNSRCLQCTIWKQSDPPDPLTLDEIETFFRRNPRFSWIDITGGEPFLRPDLSELIAILLRHSPRLYHLHLPSNAVAPALTIQRIQEILALDPPRLSLTLSLDGTPEQHDILRGVSGNWRNALEIYRHFERHPDPRLQLYFGFTLSDRNVGTLTATMEAVRRQLPHTHWRHWHLNLAHHSAHYYQNENTTLRSASNRPAFLEELTTLHARKRTRSPDPVAFLERRYLAIARRFIAGQHHPMPCLALSSSLFLDPDGTCLPCSIWDRPVGGLREHEFQLSRLLAAAPARQARQEILSARCPGCWTPCDAYPTILGNLLPTIHGSSS